MAELSKSKNVWCLISSHEAVSMESLNNWLNKTGQYQYYYEYYEEDIQQQNEHSRNGSLHLYIDLVCTLSVVIFFVFNILK